MDYKSDDSDEWAREELPPLPVIKQSEAKLSFDDKFRTRTALEDEESYWDVKSIVKEEPESSNVQPKEEEGFPMLLVDLTLLSDGLIHSKFDQNAVNDPVAVKVLRTQIEADYQKNANDATLLLNKIIVPCGSTVWRPALISLREETPGHYWCPVFPPKKS